MARLNVFNFVTLNGYFKGPHEDLSWHKQGVGPEENEYAEQGAQSDSILLFGRATYEMMAGWWPTPQAIATTPGIAQGMNNSEKIVFSHTLQEATWNNTRVVKNMEEEVRRLKQGAGKGMTLLGSGSITTQLAELGLIDTFQFMIDPVALGNGTPLFKDISHQLDLKLTNSRIFKSGAVLLTYQPAEIH